MIPAFILSFIVLLILRLINYPNGVRQKKAMAIVSILFLPDFVIVGFRMCGSPSKVYDYAENNAWWFKNSWEVAIHEFGHAMDWAISEIDSSFASKLNEAYENAKDEGLWTYHLTSSPNSRRNNPAEYWAEGIEAWFIGKNETRIGWLDGAKSPPLNKVTLPELDPLLYELLNEWLPHVDLEP